MEGDSGTVLTFTGRAPAWRSLAAWLAVGALLVGGAARAEGREVSASLELSTGHGYRAWSLLGDIALSPATTFLTLGYVGARPEEGTATTHQLSVGVDHLAGEHVLLSAAASLGLPKTTSTPLTAELPQRRLPSVDARTGSSSQGLLVTAAYDSAGFSSVEFGVDVGVSVTRYPLSRELLVTTRAGGTDSRYQRDELLWATRPSLGGRLLLGASWEMGVRAGLTLYNQDPLTAGQFTPEEQAALGRRLENALEARRLLQALRNRLGRDLGATVSRRMSDINATTGIPTAPSRFDVRPSLTWKPGRVVRGQLSYAFTRYTGDEGLSHVLSTRWSVRLGEPTRLWASVALQSDHLGEAAMGETAAPERSALFTFGGEYTF